MPVLPFDYMGLTSTDLSNVWIIPEVKTTGIKAADEGGVSMDLIIIIGSSLGGTIVLCCLCYCVTMCCAKRSHQVSYLDEEKKGTMSKVR